MVDAYALIYRFYYAFLGRPMRNASGMNTSVVFGFTRFLRDILAREKPHYLGVAFDPKGGTFRNELFPAYKANRSETPEDIIASVPHVKAVLAAMRIPVLEVPGYEADDVIGTLATKAADHGFEVFMVTPDKDFGQLVGPHINIYKQRTGADSIEIVGQEQVKANYGISDPRQVIDILALWGDASDNIPGVAGIGEKGASKLVQQWGTVENIIENIDMLSGKQRDNIAAGAEQLLLSKRLATIVTDAPVGFDPGRLVVEHPDCEALRREFVALGFNQLTRELDAGVFVPEYCRNNAASCSAGAADTSAGMLPQAGSTSQAKEKQSKPSARQKSSLAGQGSLFESDGDGTGGDTGVLAMATGAGKAEAVQENTAAGAVHEPRDGDYRTAADTEHKYTVIADPGTLADVVAQLRAAGEFCFDTETTGFDPFSDRMVGMSFSIAAHRAWYLPLDKNNTGEYVTILKPLFEDETITKRGQNIKFDMMMLRGSGVELRGVLFDTMLLHYLLDPDSRHGMDYLSRTYLGYSPIAIESLIGRGAKQLTMDRVAVDLVAEYAAEDADVTWQLGEVLWPAVVGEGMGALYRDIDGPLIGVLADMELAGVRIDPQILSGIARSLEIDMAAVEAHVRELAGEPSLNINSPRQLGEVLFDKLKIAPNPKRTKTKQYSTDEEYLQSLAPANPIVGEILEYRGIKKLLSTYVEALPLLVNPRTGRIHTSYNQAVAATGRLSSTNPNLQNIPVRDARGREIRKAFVAADADHVLMSADYSQVELRLMAHMSGDEALIEAFRRGEDIHAATAARIFNVPLGEVTQEQRRRAKTANFGIIYGISAFGLSQRLNIPRAEAKSLIDGYFASYPGVKAYMDNTIAHAREQGYVSTIFGRKRLLPDIRSANAVTRGLAERNAINAPLQGSAADIIKLAMIAVHREFRDAGLRSKLILQVHDELVVDVYRPESDRVKEIVVRCMEHAAKLSVDLIVDVGTGDNWFEAH